MEEGRIKTNLASTVNGGGRHLCEDRALNAILDDMASRNFGCSCVCNAGRLSYVSTHRIFIGISGTLWACSVSHRKLHIMCQKLVCPQRVQQRGPEYAHASCWPC